ncbi:MAG: hypothetical protein O2832_02225 [Proteobacteria bacterium]|nr:hypothetical protein [Pseudomonadota bacterium]
MAGQEIYKLVLDTLTAFGTAGAVIVTLWHTRPNKPRFKVLSVESRVDTIVDEAINLRIEKHYLLITIENLRDVPMQIFRVMIQNGAVGTGNSLDQNFIPALSSYAVELCFSDDTQRDFSKNIKTLTCEVKTSFGDKTYALSKEETKLIISHLKYQVNEQETKK